MDDKKPQDTKINEGFAKVHNAGELISEEEIARLAEKAKEEAKANMEKHEAKKSQKK
ncbi:hypothetical protein [Gibbsiella quercinecans]|uniref:hypothetical protein n=1 Tax=Gibbsiella quercinecans TaxID=929813 RepID=UPI0016010722|nr:hypothetical protein [Gibbsiella quercinecans]